MSEGMRLLQEVLDDDQWHNYEKLKELLVVSEVELPGKGPRYQRARNTILRLSRWNGYEARKNGKRRIEAIRKRPGVKSGESLVTCSRCGQSSLTTRERVLRKIVMRRYFKESGRQRDIEYGAIHLCFPCAREELELHGMDLKPLTEGGEA